MMTVSQKNIQGEIFMICSKCGAQVAPGNSFCQNCGNKITEEVTETPVYQQPAAQQSAAQQTAAFEQRKPENIAGGILGALLGAIAGGALIVLLSRFGYIASVSGLVLVLCTTFGYQKCSGGYLGKAGLITCLVLIAVTPYLADRIDWAILAMDEFKIGFAEAFRIIPELIKLEAIELGDYIKNLVMLYVFAAVGACGAFASAFKKK